MDAPWTIVDEAGAPLGGLLVASADGSALARSDGEGRVRLDAPQVRVLDALGLRVVAHREEPGRLVVRREDATGWAVADAPLEPGNAIDLFADAHMFPPILRAIDGARETIHVSQLLFFDDFRAPESLLAAPRRPVLEHLLDASARGVTVRLLLNENLMVPDTVDEVLARCGGNACIEVRPFPMSPNVLHAKILVVDGTEAWILGPPFEQRYLDTPSHAAHEPMRNDPRPLHDFSLRIRGPSVARLDRFFAGLWGVRGEACPSYPPPRARGDATLQLVTTLPRGTLPGEGWQERGAREAYQRALAMAEDYVYLETQYFTSPSIVEAIAAALHAKPRLQVIVVLNVDVDVPLYVTWQKVRLASLGHPTHPRLGVFTLASPGPDPRRPRPVYVHSKIALVDDVWASVGTSNLDSMSLERGQEWGFEVESNVDVNALVLDGIEGAPATGVVASWRRRIWAEHLGDGGVWTARRPEGGWLPLWRRVADENLRALDEGRFPARGRALPYAAPPPFPVDPQAPLGARAQEARHG